MGNSRTSKVDPRALMAKAIMRPLTDDDSILNKWIDGSSMDGFAETFIKPSLNMSSLERLEVYNQQYWFRLLDSLREDFPGLLTVLGEERFHELAVAYLTKYQSRCFTLRNLGEHLLKFVKDDNTFFKKQDKRLILDVVTFEWSEIQAFDAESRETIDFEKFQGLAGAELTLELQPYVFVLSLDYAVDEFLLKRKKIADGRTTVTAKKSVQDERPVHLARPKKQKNHVVIHRQNNSVFYKRINVVEFKVLTEIKKGASLTTACSKVTAQDLSLAYGNEEAIGSIGNSFSQWTKLGWFCSIQS